MFGVIEDIKKKTFDEAVPFTLHSFPEYLDHIRPKLGINVGALIGHSAVRLYVMGTASQERAATPDEIAQMCELVEESMAAGALGISSSYVDMDEKGKPVPSQYADIDEKIALAKAMAKSGRGIWQIVPYFPDLNRELDNIRELGFKPRRFPNQRDLECFRLITLNLKQLPANAVATRNENTVAGQGNGLSHTLHFCPGVLPEDLAGKRFVCGDIAIIKNKDLTHTRNRCYLW